jgi:hypothetical protein
MPDGFLLFLRAIRGERDLGTDRPKLNHYQVPSNIVLKRLSPSLWLSVLMFLWGIMMVCDLFIHFHTG